jgi:hypothetical protein
LPLTFIDVGSLLDPYKLHHRSLSCNTRHNPLGFVTLTSTISLWTCLLRTFPTRNRVGKLQLADQRNTLCAVVKCEKKRGVINVPRLAIALCCCSRRSCSVSFRGRATPDKS